MNDTPAVSNSVLNTQFGLGSLGGNKAVLNNAQQMAPRVYTVSPTAICKPGGGFKIQPQSDQVSYKQKVKNLAAWSSPECSSTLSLGAQQSAINEAADETISERNLLPNSLEEPQFEPERLYRSEKLVKFWHQSQRTMMEDRCRSNEFALDKAVNTENRTVSVNNSVMNFKPTLGEHRLNAPVDIRFLRGNKALDYVRRMTARVKYTFMPTANPEAVADIKTHSTDQSIQNVDSEQNVDREQSPPLSVAEILKDDSLHEGTSASVSGHQSTLPVAVDAVSEKSVVPEILTHEPEWTPERELSIAKVVKVQNQFRLHEPTLAQTINKDNRLLTVKNPMMNVEPAVKGDASTEVGVGLRCDNKESVRLKTGRFEYNSMTATICETGGIKTYTDPPIQTAEKEQLPPVCAAELQKDDQQVEPQTQQEKPEILQHQEKVNVLIPELYKLSSK